MLEIIMPCYGSEELEKSYSFLKKPSIFKNLYQTNINIRGKWNLSSNMDSEANIELLALIEAEIRH